MSYHEEIHAFILEYMLTLCLKAFVYSFKTFTYDKLEKTATTVFCFKSNYKYEKIVCYVCILDQFLGVTAHLKASHLKRNFLICFLMDYRDFSVKSKVIISMFQMVRLSLSIFTVCKFVLSSIKYH